MSDVITAPAACNLDHGWNSLRLRPGHRSSYYCPPPFQLFADRPPLSGGLPSQARHIADVFPEWWKQQTSRGWPIGGQSQSDTLNRKAFESRAVLMIATEGKSNVHPRAYSHINGAPSYDSVTAIKTASAPKRFGGEEPPIRRETLPAVINGQLT